MELILLERVEKLGQIGDVVNVKNGYGRNYLLPTNKAIRATKSNLEMFAARKVQLETQNLETRKEAEAVATKLDGKEVILIRQASEGGQLYGSVSAKDIAEALTEAGFAMNKNQVLMKAPTKTIGIFDYKVKLHPEVSVTVWINVSQSHEEAKAQSARKEKGEDVVVTAASRDAKEQADQLHAQASARAEVMAEVAAEEAEQPEA
ncbi:MAG: 50S ribosomal protein L9 [Alphaproteobacteria bacterium]